MNHVIRAALGLLLLCGCFEAHEMGQWMTVARPDAGNTSAGVDAGHTSAAVDAGQIPDGGDASGTFVAWEQVGLGPVASVIDVWGNARDDVWVSGNTTLHFDGTAWNELPHGDLVGGVWGIWGSGRGDLWGVGSGGRIFHRSNGSPWQSVPSGTTARLRRVWGLGPTDLWVIGDAGTLLHGDGQAFTEVASGTTEDIVGIWGASSDDVWAVTGWAGPGQVLHWDGKAWALHLTHPSLAAGVGWGNTIWGSSANDVWIVGGRFLHWNGNTWSDLPKPDEASYLLAIFGAAADDAWVVEKGGRMFHWDGAAWTMGSVTCDERLNIGGIGGRHPESSGRSRGPMCSPTPGSSTALGERYGVIGAGLVSELRTWSRQAPSMNRYCFA
ncbi:MAG: hypothetical protein QM765_34075 [Myxococcales bacterium]